MKDELNPEDLLNRMAEEFLPDCIDYWREFNRYRFNLRQLLPLLPANAKVLDLGAGNGVMSLALQAAGADVTAADNWLPYAQSDTESEPAMHRTGERNHILERFRKHNVQILETDLLKGNLPLGDESFDLAIILAVIEHFPGSPSKILEEANGS